jgi:hypothetical protein
VICPTPNKRSFDNEKDAELVMGIWQARAWNRKAPIRVYLCPCGQYHTTSKPQRDRAVHRLSPVTSVPVPAVLS